MYPTVEQVLALPVICDGAPAVTAGAVGLRRRVRWVHVAEVADIAHLLRGGELVLTTGIALPTDDDALCAYVDELAAVGAAGLVVELVRRWEAVLPEALRAAADRHGLPLVTLSRETRFVSVTEAVVGLIMDAQVAELRAAEAIHETFTELTVSGAEPAEVLREVARASGLPAVLENLAHEVLGYDSAGRDPTELLARWDQRSRAVVCTRRTGYHEETGWLVTLVGARGVDWGRLILLSPEQPPHRHMVVAERAASALAVQRLVARDRDSLERQAHRALLTELGTPSAPPADLLARCDALGVPLRDRLLVGLTVRPRVSGPARPAAALATQQVLRDLAETTALAASRSGVSALVAVVDETSVSGLLALDRGCDVSAALGRLATYVHEGLSGAARTPPVVVAAGTTVDVLSAAGRSLGEAAHVAGAALRLPDDRPYHRLDDVRLRGLLHLLRDDERVSAFVSRELGRLVARDAEHGGRLLPLLRHYCEHGGNKSAAAAAAHLSRTAYYQQLARIEKVLGVSLDAPESVLSLHVALLAMDAQRGAAAPHPTPPAQRQPEEAR